MKKILTVLLSAVMLLGTVFAFGACGDGGKLIVATNAYFPPFEFYEGNAFSGVDMEIAHGMAGDMGKTLFIKDMEFDSIISSVKIGESDIGMAGMTITDTRLEQVDFTDEYYESAQVIIVKADDTTFDACTTASDIETILKTKTTDYKIGTQNGTTGYMYSKGDADFGYDGFTNLTTNSYTTGALAVTDLKNGNLNAVIIDKQPALMIAQSVGGVKVIENISLTSEKYAFCVKKGNTDLLNKANSYLKKIKDNGTLDRIINSFFNGSSDFTYTNPAE